MNTNTYEGLTTIAAQDLRPGQSFIYNYAGGVRTVYLATEVRTGGHVTAITYRTEGFRGESRFTTAPLSTIVLV